MSLYDRSTCCGAPFSVEGEITRYYKCAACLLACDVKPMKHEVKVGDRFRLGVWEWEVISKHMDGFEAKRDTADGTCLFGDDEADKLDWIKPEPTCSKEFADFLINVIENECRADVGLRYLINAHTEKE